MCKDKDILKRKSNVPIEKSTVAIKFTSSLILCVSYTCYKSYIYRHFIKTVHWK